MTTADAPPVIDLPALLARFDQDAELIVQAAGDLIDHLPDLAAAVHAALAAGDRVALQHAAHKLRGSVATFGSTPASHAAEHLETMGETGDLAGGAAAEAALDAARAELTAALAGVRDALRPPGGDPQSSGEKPANSSAARNVAQ